MRSFIALPLPEDTREALTRLTEDLESGRPVAPENFHLTLAFLGDQSTQTLALLDEGLRDIAAPSFEMELQGLDLFGGRQPRAVYAAVTATDALTTLRRKVRLAVRDAGIDLPRERFRPHVTLARFAPTTPQHELDKLGHFLTVHGDMALPPVAVRAFALYRSRLSHDGPVYERLADYPLG
jgi:2'-5' RNA ligase